MMRDANRYMDGIFIFLMFFLIEIHIKHVSFRVMIQMVLILQVSNILRDFHKTEETEMLFSPGEQPVWETDERAKEVTRR